MPTDQWVLEDLVAQLDRFPARSATAVEVLWLVNDPRESASHLAAVVTGDEALTTRLMRMANAPFYGLSGRVASAAFAITVLGFDTVRAVAASAAAGVLHDTVPPVMQRQASMTAAAASLIAPGLGERPSEATSLGLLHNLGSMLLHRHDPAAHRALTARAAAEGRALHRLEREHFGAPGHDLAGAVLRRWSFPGAFVEALESQADPLGVHRTPLGRVLVAARAAVQEVLLGSLGDPAAADRRAAMAQGKVTPELLDRLRAEADGLDPPLVG